MQPSRIFSGSQLPPRPGKAPPGQENGGDNSVSVIFGACPPRTERVSRAVVVSPGSTTANRFAFCSEMEEGGLAGTASPKTASCRPHA